ncbi:hypothetical protein MRX96_024149 [Rhipicephalus microplus]
MNIPSGQEVTQGILPEQKREQSEILMLKKENAELKEALRTLRAEFELFRNSREPREVATLIPVQAGRSNKRKAVSPPRSRKAWQCKVTSPPLRSLRKMYSRL